MKIQISKESRLVLFVFVLCFMVAFSPYVRPDLVKGSDDTFHLIRIETLATAIARGEFPVKFHSDLCYGYGYGVGFFYSDFFLYIPAVLINLGFSLEVAYKLFAGLILAVTFWGMYLSVWKLTKNLRSALMAASLYLLSVSVLRNIYQAFATSRALAMIFLPMAIIGMYLLLTENRGRELLIAGFSGLIYSHVLMTVLAVAVCICMVVICWRKWIRNGEKWKSLIISVISVCVLTAASWIPMLEQWAVQEYRAAVPWTWVDENVVLMKDLLSDESVGRFLLALILIQLFYLMIHDGWKGKWSIFLGLGFGFWGITIIYKFWHITRNAFKFLQFPDRLFPIATTLFILGVACWIASWQLEKRIMTGCMALIIVFNIGYAYQYMVPRIEDTMDLGYTTLHEEIAGLGAGEEWLPIQTTRDYLVLPREAKTPEGLSAGGEARENKFSFMVDTDDYYDIPFVWYKGFYAETQEGETVRTGQVPETGLVRVFTDELKAGDIVTVWYRGTIAQKISYIITIAGCIYAVGWIIKNRKKILN